MAPTFVDAQSPDFNPYDYADCMYTAQDPSSWGQFFRSLDSEQMSVVAPRIRNLIMNDETQARTALSELDIGEQPDLSAIVHPDFRDVVDSYASGQIDRTGAEARIQEEYDERWAAYEERGGSTVESRNEQRLEGLQDRDAERHLDYIDREVERAEQGGMSGEDLDNYRSELENEFFPDGLPTPSEPDHPVVGSPCARTFQI
ncbi:MAG: hypothetical protein AAF569_02400 [Pseudomonadota bacterium]